MDAIALLRDVKGCELEVAALSHKVKAMYTQGKEGLTGKDFIDACSDEELAVAIAQRDKRVGLSPFIDPFLFNYLRNHRSKALSMGQEMR